MQLEIILPGVTRRPLHRRVDSRGWLLKLLMREHVTSAREFGEIYITAAHQGQVKGNHYHERACEWFCVIEGRATMALRVMATGERASIELDADRPEIIEVAPGVAHAFKNTNPALMMLLAYADDPYNAENPDEVRIELLRSDAVASGA
ncbi:MAG: cupin domain-containing protein [Nitrospirota bacterium]